MTAPEFPFAILAWLALNGAVVAGSGWGERRRGTENGPRSLACRPSADKRKLGAIELSNMAAVDYYKVVRGDGKGSGCLRASAHIVGEEGGQGAVVRLQISSANYVVINCANYFSFSALRFVLHPTSLSS